MVLLEVCIDSIESGIIAEKNGASRVELCDNLVEGGTTPSAGMIALAKKLLKIPVYVMIRPRFFSFSFVLFFILFYFILFYLCFSLMFYFSLNQIK